MPLMHISPFEAENYQTHRAAGKIIFLYILGLGFSAEDGKKINS
jgi:hypothetical protein